MNKLHFTALSLCLMAIGCTNDESFYEQSEIDDNGVVVLQERNAAVSIRPRACFSPSYNKVKSQTKHVWLLTLL